jgi:ArsR family transcriptional regulator
MPYAGAAVLGNPANRFDRRPNPGPLCRSFTAISLDTTRDGDYIFPWRNVKEVLVVPKTARPANRTDCMFRAFSDRTRLRILYLLRDGEFCVGNLVDVLRVEQPRASRHLAYLRRAGLVTVRRAGLWCYYSLAPAREPFHAKLLECLTCCFSEVPEIRADQARAKKIRKAGGCCPGSEREESGQAAKYPGPGTCCPES